MPNPTIVIYTHTDYKDIWPIILGQNEKYFKNYSKKIFLNRYIEYIDRDIKQFFYDEKDSYTDRVASCLRQLSEDEIILFLHEDMPLFNKPNYNILSDFLNIIKNEDADFIQLLKASQNNIFINSKIHKNLIENNSGHLFSVQPTICKVKKIKKLFENISGHGIWDFETKTSIFCNYKKCFMAHEINEPKRGLYHWDSFIYPYIATAIVKGRWNFSEYSRELNELISIYNIDKNKRGTNLYV